MLTIPGYADSLISSDGVAFETKEQGSSKWIKVYNNTGSAISNGAIKMLAFNISSGVLIPIMIAPATMATASAIVGVVDNSLFGKATIPDGEWGWLKLQGQVDALVDGTSDVAAGVGLEVLNTGTAFVVAGQAAGAALVAECAAIALEARTDNSAGLQSVYLIGRQVVIAAS